MNANLGEVRSNQNFDQQKLKNYLTSNKSLIFQ